MGNEALQLPEDVLPMVPRSAMPQVDEIYYPDLFVWLGDQGITFSAGHCDPLGIRVHQLIDFEKAAHIPEAVLLKPVLLSRDGCVLDGDHRWYRHLCDKTQMPFIRLELDFLPAITLLEKYPKVYEVKA